MNVKRKFWPQISRRTLLVTVTITVACYALWFLTDVWGTVAVNSYEAEKFGKDYMQLRTDDPKSYFPLVVQTGTSTTGFRFSTKSTYVVPVSRRYYLWVGRVIPVYEWYNPKISDRLRNSISAG